jgi:hypothetical protein
MERMLYYGVGFRSHGAGWQLQKTGQERKRTRVERDDVLEALTKITRASGRLITRPMRPKSS